MGLPLLPASVVQQRGHCGGGASQLAAPGGMRAAASSRNEGDDKRGGINPLRAQGEIMREI